VPATAPASTLDRLRSAAIGAYFRPRDVRSHGVTFYELQRCIERGEVERVSRGIYRLSDVELDETETTASVATAIPHGIVCLLSALRYHDIGTQNPWEVWIAIDRRRRAPVSAPARVRLMRFSGPMLTYGVVTVRMLGVPVKITNPARTVVDCIRYRNKIGLDAALEALHDSLRRKKVTVDQLVRTAEMCRAGTVVRRYLEAMP
jgi:predicted transcriptional regulator of viral defense system